MALVLGADSCRCMAADGGDILCTPSLFMHHRKTDQVGVPERSTGESVKSGRAVGWNPNANYDWWFPFDAEPLIDQYILPRLLNYFRRQLASGLNCCQPRRLMVTGRPDLVEAIRPLFAAAARKAGFSAAQLVDELAIPRPASFSPQLPAQTVGRYLSVNEMSTPARRARSTCRTARRATG